jgi:tRNA(adenine34) deaminase
MRYISFEEEAAISPDEYFMGEALKEARYALKEDEIPIGAIVVYNGRIIGKGHNLTERLNDVSAHAEMQALTAAANLMGVNTCKAVRYTLLWSHVLCVPGLHTGSR